MVKQKLSGLEMVWEKQSTHGQSLYSQGLPVSKNNRVSSDDSFSLIAIAICQCVCLYD